MGFKPVKTKYYIVREDYVDKNCNIIVSEIKKEISKEALKEIQDRANGNLYSSNESLFLNSFIYYLIQVILGGNNGQVHIGKDTRGNKPKHNSKTKGCWKDLHGCNNKRRNRTICQSAQSFKRNCKKSKKHIRG